MGASTSDAGETVLQKQRLRQELLAKRRALSPQEVYRRSARVIEHVLSSPGFAEAGAVLCYLAHDNEVDTTHLIRHLLQESGNIYVPKCLPQHQLAWNRLHRDTPLRPSRFGVMEPVVWEEPYVAGEQPALLLAPGVAFSSDGYRLGYGGGYFDRFLENFTGTAWGLAYDFQLLPALPLAPHDRALHAVITETGFCSASAFP